MILDLGAGWAAEFRSDGIAVSHQSGGLHMADTFEQHIIRRLAGVEAERDKLLDALWKASGDNLEVVNGYRESVGLEPLP